MFQAKKKKCCVALSNRPIPRNEKGGGGGGSSIRNAPNFVRLGVFVFFTFFEKKKVEMYPNVLLGVK